MIYLIYFNDKEKAEENIKESAFAEYPFGQSNFGLFSQFYLGKIENAKYMFMKSSKHEFSLSEYNLSQIYAKENKTKKSIEYLKRASDHANKSLIFRDITRYDMKLEISKLFIICFTNIKLTEYYFSNGEYDESKKYFIKAFTYNDPTYPFKFQIQFQ